MATPRIVVEDATGELCSTTADVVFGCRTGCTVVLDDPIAAGRHCAFAHDGAFRVRDLGSVTGTWLDGKKVEGTAEVKDGAAIVFGASRVLAKVEDRDGTPTLVLNLQRNGFWWRKSGKKVFDNDPDALVRSEVAFGRFPLLTLGNRLAMVVGAVLLVAATFVAAVMEPLADAGPLVPTHAFVTGDAKIDATHANLVRCRGLADAQGCNVCHVTGEGTPERKCLQCHADFAEPQSFRHPYVGDGKLGSSSGMQAGQEFCVLCHRDHVGNDWLKPASDTLVGKCDACHSDGKAQLDRDALLAKAPPQPLPTRQRAFAAWRFPHDQHVQKGIDCAVCHQLDPDVVANKQAGRPDDPARQDFAEAPYETCAACHVPGAPAAGLTAEQQTKWRAKDHQWNVAWHGTDGDGAGCRKCHTQSERGGRTVFGPEFPMVARATATPEQHAAERARYASPQRLHTAEFQAHANGKACTTCHLDGKVAAAEPSPRTFWHALHVTDGALQPKAGDGGKVSTDAKAGCLSCHGEVRGQKALTDATQAAYHWPATADAQAACKDCHREREGEPLALTARSTTIAAERRGTAIAFPHDVHVTSKAFGSSGSLADGCFACHEFQKPANGGEHTFVPRVKAGAANCTQCHQGHADVGGGECRQCHPVVADQASSFQIAANVPPGTSVFGKPAPDVGKRAWPGKNGFSHQSRGHVGPEITCATCHDPKALAAAKDLATVPVPDDATPACRECHLKKQFHWR
ncbi:MAG: FHA domain-containing protein [Planctomycetes bacterium]|nr:FHA domain-containing protein [Planctomycetota bacterium]